MEICSELLAEWCNKMLELQVKEPLIKGITGGILCPACARIHGRSFDAFYPFLYMADKQKEEKFLHAALLLYEWAEECISMPDGAYRNDCNSQWKGITVFAVIQMSEAMKYHGHILSETWRQRILDRIGRAAEFISHFEELNHNNVNYLIANCLALYLSGKLLQRECYISQAAELWAKTQIYISEEKILFGEGCPAEEYSPKGCKPVDMGYNIEESLPILAQYAYESQNERLLTQTLNILKAQQAFILEDGAVDNSFGTRNFKWTYWGSRTTDGCGLGYLLFADREPSFGYTVFQNISLLQKCTHDGLLYGGLHNWELEEKPCVHHTFTHAKVLAGILNHGVEKFLCSFSPARVETIRHRYYSDMAVHRIEGPSYLADISLYDWEYGKLKHGHASGGMMTMLWQYQYGPVLCAGMNQYEMEEADNMQSPVLSYHQVISPRIEWEGKETVYSSLYDFSSSLNVKTNEPLCMEVKGALANENHQYLTVQNGCYTLEYIFEQKKVSFRAVLPEKSHVVFPIIASPHTRVLWDGKSLLCEKEGARVTLSIENGTGILPYKEKRIYSLIPGLSAVKVEIYASKGKQREVMWSIHVE